MVGHIDTEDPHSLIVSDVFPLPVEGTETTVMTANQDVLNYMVSLSDSLEAVREENMMGWYHSHPFDVCDHSNAFLSATGEGGVGGWGLLDQQQQSPVCSARFASSTDVSTQLSWQLSEDRAGNPWLALVVRRCMRQPARPTPL